MEWLNRMTDAIDFIEEHLKEPIAMEDIARRAYASSFHFQRTFHVLTGVTVAEYMRKRRLTLAAQELCTSPTLKVVDVALKYGYESPESFTKAFRKVHGLTPSDARTLGVPLKAFPRLSFHLSLKGDQDMDYRIIHRDRFAVTGKRLRVSTQDGENFRRIPQFWETSYADGTVAALRALRPDGVLLGICLTNDHDHEEMTYAIAVEGTFEGPETPVGPRPRSQRPHGRPSPRSAGSPMPFSTCGPAFLKSGFRPRGTNTLAALNSKSCRPAMIWTSRISARSGFPS